MSRFDLVRSGYLLRTEPGTSTFLVDYIHSPEDLQHHSDWGRPPPSLLI